jgi:hypothetical protein
MGEGELMELLADVEHLAAQDPRALVQTVGAVALLAYRAGERGQALGDLVAVLVERLGSRR